MEKQIRARELIEAGKMTGAGFCTGESLQFYFYPEENMLYDEGGYAVFNPYRYVDPKIWQLFKLNRDYVCIRNKDGYFIELFWVENENV